jgi:hypothetical protein
MTAVRKSSGASFVGPELPLSKARALAERYQAESDATGGNFDYGVFEVPESK